MPLILEITFTVANTEIAPSSAGQGPCIWLSAESLSDRGSPLALLARRFLDRLDHVRKVHIHARGKGGLGLYIHKRLHHFLLILHLFASLSLSLSLSFFLSFFISYLLIPACAISPCQLCFHTFSLPK